MSRIVFHLRVIREPSLPYLIVRLTLLYTFSRIILTSVHDPQVIYDLLILRVSEMKIIDS